MQELKWVPTPSFLYRNYLYLRIARSLPSNTYFLDIGSGNGDFVKKMLSLGFKGESLDYSPKAVSFMRRQMGKNPNINIRLGNIFTFKSQKKFDTIFAFETLEHIKDDGPCMEKIFQLLKPGGMFIMSVPAHMSLWDKVDELKGHFRRYEKNDLVSQIEKTGFLLQKFWCYGFPFLNLIRLISGSGALIESPVPGQKTQRTEESSIQLEYNPILAPFVTSPIITAPLYTIMGLFLHTDLGLGYILVAKKPIFQSAKIKSGTEISQKTIRA